MTIWGDQTLQCNPMTVGGLEVKNRFRDSMVLGSKEVLQFDFTNRLAPGETISGVASGFPEVSVSYGTDPSPGSILNGSPTVSSDGLSILVPVQTMTAGVTNTDYDIKVVAVTTNTAKQPGMVGTLSVRY